MSKPIVVGLPLCFGVNPDLKAPEGWAKIEAENDWLYIESPDGKRYFAVIEGGEIIGGMPVMDGGRCDTLNPMHFKDWRKLSDRQAKSITPTSS